MRHWLISGTSGFDLPFIWNLKKIEKYRNSRMKFPRDRRLEDSILPMTRSMYARDLIFNLTNKSKQNNAVCFKVARRVELKCSHHIEGGRDV